MEGADDGRERDAVQGARSLNRDDAVPRAKKADDAGARELTNRAFSAMSGRWQREARA